MAQLLHNVILLNRHLIGTNEFTNVTALLQLTIIALYKKKNVMEICKKITEIVSTYKQRICM